MNAVVSNAYNGFYLFIYLFFRKKVKKFSSALSCKYTLRCVGLSHEDPIRHIYVYGCNVRKYEEVQRVYKLLQGAVSPLGCVHLSAVAEYHVKMQILSFYYSVSFLEALIEVVFFPLLQKRSGILDAVCLHSL